MFGSASQGGKQADRLCIGMLGSLIAFLWSAAEYLQLFKGVIHAFTHSSRLKAHFY